MRMIPPSVRNPDLQTALSYFRNWHFQLSKDDVPTTLFHVFFTHLLKNIFQNKMGDALFEKYIFIANIPYRTVPALMRNPSSWWFDDPSTPQVETRDDVIRKSLREAIQELKTSLGGEMKTWQWGLIHTVTFRHPFGSQPPLGSVFNIGPFPDRRFRNDAQQRRILSGRSVPGDARAFDAADCRFLGHQRRALDHSDRRIGSADARTLFRPNAVVAERRIPSDADRQRTGYGSGKTHALASSCQL